MKISSIVVALPMLLLIGVLSFMHVSCSDQVEIHEINFNSQGGSAVAAVEAVEGQKLNEPSPPTKVGYAFEGWYTDPEHTIEWNFITDTVTSDMTLHAKWSADEYMVTYHANGATSGTVPTVSTKIHDIDHIVSANVGNLVLAGYAFSGWNTQPDGSGSDYAAASTYAANAAVTLYARWVPDSNTAYAVEHHQEDVSGSGYTRYASESKSGTTGSIVEAMAKNYTGFAVNTGHPSSVASGTIAGDGTLVLKLFYDRDMFAVSFIENEGSSVADLDGVRYGATVPAPEAPTRIGYSFGGWYQDSGLTDAWSFTDDVVTEATELFAMWTANTYSITYVLNNGTNNADNPDTYTIETTTIALQDPTRSDYPFEGWFLSSDFSGSPAAQIDSGSTGDKTLYAKWKVYHIRDIGPAGGYIFYAKSTYNNGWQYLEAAPYGWYEGATDSDGPYSGEIDPVFEWGAYGYAIDPSATATAVGTGETNTMHIVSYHDALEDYYADPTAYHADSDGTVAAKVCAEYSLEHGGVTHDDWFLPSKDELNLMYTNLYQYNFGGFYTDWAYWSSSEFDGFEAYAKAFNTIMQGHTLRTNDLLVRPVRAF